MLTIIVAAVLCGLLAMLLTYWARTFLARRRERIEEAVWRRVRNAHEAGLNEGVVIGYSRGFARGLVVGARADVDGNPGRVSPVRGQA
jgi:hypothetical protein